MTRITVPAPLHSRLAFNSLSVKYFKMKRLLNTYINLYVSFYLMIRARDG